MREASPATCKRANYAQTARVNDLAEKVAETDHLGGTKVRGLCNHEDREAHEDRLVFVFFVNFVVKGLAVQSATTELCGKS